MGINTLFNFDILRKRETGLRAESEIFRKADDFVGMYTSLMNELRRGPTHKALGISFDTDTFFTRSLEEASAKVEKSDNANDLVRLKLLQLTLRSQQQIADALGRVNQSKVEPPKTRGHEWRAYTMDDWLRDSVHYADSTMIRPDDWDERLGIVGRMLFREKYGEPEQGKKVRIIPGFFGAGMLLGKNDYAKYYYDKSSVDSVQLDTAGQSGGFHANVGAVSQEGLGRVGLKLNPDYALPRTLVHEIQGHGLFNVLAETNVLPSTVKRYFDWSLGEEVITSSEVGDYLAFARGRIPIMEAAFVNEAFAICTDAAWNLPLTHAIELAHSNTLYDFARKAVDNPFERVANSLPRALASTFKLEWQHHIEECSSIPALIQYLLLTPDWRKGRGYGEPQWQQLGKRFEKGDQESNRKKFFKHYLPLLFAMEPMSEWSKPDGTFNKLLRSLFTTDPKHVLEIAVGAGDCTFSFRGI